MICKGCEGLIDAFWCVEVEPCHMHRRMQNTEVHGLVSFEESIASCEEPAVAAEMVEIYIYIAYCCHSTKN